jgi:hypothetical protein
MKLNAFVTSTSLTGAIKVKRAAPSFGTPKKNGQVWFVSDFCQLNKWIIHWPYPMLSIHKLFKPFEGFTYCTALDLNMGLWTIPLNKHSQHLCTIILPWAKFCYLHLPMGLACSPDVYNYSSTWSPSLLAC